MKILKLTSAVDENKDVFINIDDISAFYDTIAYFEETGNKIVECTKVILKNGTEIYVSDTAKDIDFGIKFWSSHNR